MEINPYIRAAITVVIYLAAAGLLPEKFKGNKRHAISIAIAVALSLFVFFIMDCVKEAI